MMEKVSQAIVGEVRICVGWAQVCAVDNYH